MDANKPNPQIPLEIRDPALNAAGLIRRIAEQVSRRRAEGLYPSADKLRAAWPQTAPGSKAALIDDDYIFRLLKDLTVDSYLQEVQFTSTAPVVGPVIVAVRRAWNWMSTRWYVLPLFKQQSRYNEQVIISMYRLLQSNRALQAQVDELQQRLTNLERADGGQ